MNQGFLNPESVLKQLKLKKTMTAADFGCGSGFWAFPLARKLEEGKVYAIDILEEPLSALKARAKLEKLLNIETTHSDIEDKGGSKLIDNSCDLVLLTNLLFEVENKKQVLEEAKRVLKPGGKLLVVDWKLDTPLGPKESRIPAEEVKKTAKDLNLKLEKEFEAGVFHYGLIFKR